MLVSFLVTLVFILLTIYIPNAMSGERIHLRSQAKQLSDKDVMSMLVKHNFFDRTKNKKGVLPTTLLTTVMARRQTGPRG